MAGIQTHYPLTISSIGACLSIHSYLDSKVKAARLQTLGETFRIASVVFDAEKQSSIGQAEKWK